MAKQKGGGPPKRAVNNKGRYATSLEKQVKKRLRAVEKAQQMQRRRKH